MTQTTPDRVYIFTVDGRELETSRPDLAPGQVREMAAVPAAHALILRGATPDDDRRLADTDCIPLTPGAVEHFFTRAPGALEDTVRYRVQIDGQLYDRFERTVTGAGLKRIAALAPDAQLHREPGHLPVGDADVVDLGSAGTERFTSRAAPALLISVRAPNGAPETFPYDPNDTVAALLTRAVAKFAATGQLNPHEAFNLVFDGRTLDGASSLAAAGVRAGVVLSLRSARVPGDG